MSPSRKSIKSPKSSLSFASEKSFRAESERGTTNRANLEDAAILIQKRFRGYMCR